MITFYSTLVFEIFKKYLISRMPPAVIEKIKVGPFAQLNRYETGCF